MLRTPSNCLAIAALFGRLIARTFLGRRRRPPPFRRTRYAVLFTTPTEGGPHAE